jgi:hypothetical protein
MALFVPGMAVAYVEPRKNVAASKRAYVGAPATIAAPAERPTSPITSVRRSPNRSINAPTGSNQTA